MAAEAEGATVSIVIESAADGALLFPAESLSVAVTLQTPSDKSVAKVQAPDEIVHDTFVEPDFAAVTVTVAVPEKDPETFIVGLLILVTLSLLELPESDAVARSGVAGVEIATLLITTFASAVLVSELTPPKD